MLERMIEMVKVRNKCVMVAFINMEKVYDRVNRKKLFVCWPDGRRSWLVDHKRKHRTPPTSKGHGSG